jgi:endonuclease/exonuclease/phosphatase family metal-dependent hydrolase
MRACGRSAMLAAAGLAGGCATLPPALLADPATAPRPANSYDAANGIARTRLEVLTFNIEGLSWPARSGRAPDLARIGATLARLREAGHAPDVVLIQEMFSRAAVRAIQAMGYPNHIAGPSRTQRKRLPGAPRMSGPFTLSKGEAAFHVVGGGLAILSRYPIVAFHTEPFGRRRCAGRDCLSNKGMVHARIAVPGVPEPVDLFDTHLNSRGASRVPAERNGAAHALQVSQLSRFIDLHTAADRPVILGGDFNMRRSVARFDRYRIRAGQLTLVHEFCADRRDLCDVRMSWDGDEPWMDTQDLQFFRGGSKVSLRPARVEAMFDGAADSPKLSDHDGFRVTYGLEWQAAAPGD